MNTKIYSKVIASVVAVAIAATGFLAMPTATYAQGTNPPTTPTAPGKPEDKGKPDKEKTREGLAKGFEKQYERVQKNLRELKSQLDKVNEVTKKAQEFISEAKSKGKDTAAMELALTTFKAEVAKAQTSYDDAKKILDTHAGFDADGKVTDREAAKQTLQDASKALREGQKTLSKAVRDVQKALKDTRGDKNKDKEKDDKDKVTPTATPKP